MDRLSKGRAAFFKGPPTFAADKGLLYERSPEGRMRGLSMLDLLVVLAVVALLCFAASREFALYDSRTLPLPAATTPSRGV